MLPHLRSLFTQSTVDMILSRGSDTSNETNCYSTAQLHFLVFATTNNLPGLSRQMPLTAIYEYLRGPVSTFFGSDLGTLSHRAGPVELKHVKPMAGTILRCAIEAGHLEVVHQLLTSAELEMDVNEHVCMFDGVPWTPVERAATNHHLHLMRILIHMGADINKSWRSPKEKPPEYRRSSFGTYLPIPCGALECAILTYQPRSSAGLEAIRLLLRSGGTFRPSCLKALMDPSTATVAELLMSTRIRDEHRTWLEAGCFHKAVCHLDTVAVLELLNVLHDVGADYDYFWYPEHRRHSVDVKKELPPRLVDVAARRGDFRMLQYLQLHGAAFSDDTVTGAIRSRNVMLAQYLVDCGAEVHCFSAYFDTTPMAEAIRLRQDSTVTQLVRQGCLMDLSPQGLRPVLISAAEAGDANLLMSLLCTKVTHDPLTLGHALAKAVGSNHTDLVCILLEAGAPTDVIANGHDYLQTDVLLSAAKNRNHTLFDKILEYTPDLRFYYSDLNNGWYSRRRLVDVVREWGGISMLDDLHSAGMDLSAGLASAVSDGDLASARRLVSLCGPGPFEHHHMGDVLKSSPLAEAVDRADLMLIEELLASGAAAGDPVALCAAAAQSPAMLFTLIAACGQRRSAGLERMPREPSDIASLLSAHVKLDDLTDNCRKKVGAWLGGRGVHYYDDAYTPLAFAILRDHGQDLETVRLVLQYGVPLDTPATWYESRTWSETPLLLAVRTAECPMVRLLLEHGANINLPASKNIRRTPLQLAAEDGSWSMVKCLLENGAEVNAAPAKRGGGRWGGGTALQLAAQGGYIGIAQLLLDAGADVHAAGSEVLGHTALEAAAKYGRYDMVKYLMLHASFDEHQREAAAVLASQGSHHAVAELVRTAPSMAAVSNNPVSATHTCCDCNRPFSNAFALRRHRTIHGGSRGRYTCDTCGQVFSRKDSKARHSATHKEGYRVTCSWCGRDFSRADYLARHTKGCTQR